MKLSPTMHKAMDLAEQYGKICRFPGGYWAEPKWAGQGKWFGTSTVEALVSRGLLRYSEWKEGKHHRFPVEATPTQEDKSDD